MGSRVVMVSVVTLGNQINDLLCRALVGCGTVATRETNGLCTNAGKRPDGVTQLQWRRGRFLAWDATCRHVRIEALRPTCRQPLPLQLAKVNKTLKYDILSGIDSVPVASKTTGRARSLPCQQDWSSNRGSDALATFGRFSLQRISQRDDVGACMMQ